MFIILYVLRGCQCIGNGFDDGIYCMFDQVLVLLSFGVKMLIICIDSTVFYSKGIKT